LVNDPSRGIAIIQTFLAELDAMSGDVSIPHAG